LILNLIGSDTVSVSLPRYVWDQLNVAVGGCEYYVVLTARASWKKEAPASQSFSFSVKSDAQTGEEPKMNHSKGSRSFWNFEHRKQPLLSNRAFVRRLALAALISILLLAVWTVVGMVGYHSLAGLSWTDSFLNSAMIVGGMGPVDALTSPSAKLFAGFYALFSGVIFLSVFGLLIGPVFHRFLHRFHLDEAEKANSRSTD
jgi:hypothetical protein